MSVSSSSVGFPILVSSPQQYCFSSPTPSHHRIDSICLSTTPQGGGTGIGRQTAISLAKAGAHIAICGRRLEPLEKTAKELSAITGEEVYFASVDIRSYDKCEAFVTAVRDRYSRIDILVNNAGGQFLVLAENLSSKGFNAVVQVPFSLFLSLFSLSHSLSSLHNSVYFTHFSLLSLTATPPLSTQNNLIGTWNMTLAVATVEFIPQKRGRIVNVIVQMRRGCEFLFLSLSLSFSPSTSKLSSLQD